MDENFFKKWMHYIKDEVYLNRLIIPSAHNACTAGMNKSACCQEHGLYTQLCYGIRHFCIRLNTDKSGQIVSCHGLTKGITLIKALFEIEKFLIEQPTEFLILDIREYYDQKIGPITLKYKADKDKVDEILQKTINPEKYAFTDFDHIKDVTLKMLRESGKRYILLNYKEEYKFSKNSEHIIPWEKNINGAHAKKFVDNTLRYFDDYTTEGLYWFQTQQTPNLGVEIGISSPKKLDILLRPHFKRLIDGIKDNPLYLERANIIAGDFMTEDFLKVKEILKLNLDKNNVKKHLISDYKEALCETDCAR